MRVDEKWPHPSVHEHAVEENAMSLLRLLAALSVLTCTVPAGAGLRAYACPPDDSNPTANAGPDNSSSSDSRKEQPRSVLGDPEKYLATNSMIVQSFRLDRIRSSPLYKELSADAPKPSLVQKLAERFGLAEADVERMSGGITAKKTAVFILTTKRDVNLPKVARMAELEEAAVGLYTLYAAPDSDNSLCTPEKGICLIGNTEVLREVLKRGGKPGLNERLKKAIDRADFSRCVVMASDLGAVTSTKTVADSILQEIDLTTDYAETFTSNYKDAKTAEDKRDSFEDQTKDVYDQLGGRYTVTVSGQSLVAKITIAGDVVKKNKQKFLKKFTPGN